MNKNIINYIKLIIVVTIGVIITLLICNIYKNINKNKLNKSYIENYVSSAKYNDLSSIIMELGDNKFIYLSYVGNENIYNYEKELVKILKKNDLLETFIYIDTTSDITTNRTINDLNKKLNVITETPITLPAVIYYKDGTPKDYIDSTEEIISASKTVQLMEKWEVINE